MALESENVTLGAALRRADGRIRALEAEKERSMTALSSKERRQSKSSMSAPNGKICIAQLESRNNYHEEGPR